MLRMLLSIAGWSVLDDVTNKTSVTFVTLRVTCVCRSQYCFHCYSWGRHRCCRLRSSRRFCVRIWRNGAARFSADAADYCAGAALWTAVWLRLGERMYTGFSAGLWRRVLGWAFETPTQCCADDSLSSYDRAQVARHCWSQQQVMCPCCLQRANLVRHFCSFDIAKFICMVSVAHAHCEVASASAVARYASVGRKYRRS